MLQAYPGRDPLSDVFSGKISLRKFRVMVENLPPKNPVARAVSGEWGDEEWMLWDISGRLRDLSIQLHNLFRGNSAALEPEYLPRPEASTGEHQELEKAAEHQMQDNLLKVLARPNPH